MQTLSSTQTGGTFVLRREFSRCPPSPVPEEREREPTCTDNKDVDLA